MDVVEIICGIDEAGRGPLAGPVVAAAVVLDKKRRINGLNDSKQLTEERRDILAARIKERAVAWGVGRKSTPSTSGKPTSSPCAALSTSWA